MDAVSASIGHRKKPSEGRPVSAFRHSQSGKAVRRLSRNLGKITGGTGASNNSRMTMQYGSARPYGMVSNQNRNKALMKHEQLMQEMR